MDLDKLRELAVAHLPVPVETAQIAHETYCYRIGGPVELYDGTCPECGWRYRPSTHSAVSVHPEDLHALIEEVDRLRENKKGEVSLYSILKDLIELFGWEDKTPLHAALHVRNAVGNLRADLAVARLEVRRMSEKHDRLQERLITIEKANVDRWQEGYATAERQIAAWLRFKANDPWPYDSLDHAVEVTLKRAAESIENQEHRRKDDRED